MAERRILALNLGSSSCKFSAYSIDERRETTLAVGAAEGVGTRGGRVWIRDGSGRELANLRCEIPRSKAAVEALFEQIDKLKLPRPDAVGHRIVHGGVHHVAPELVTAELLSDLKRLIPFAPLHMPGGIEGIEAIAARMPDVAQVACFDTAFHRGMPQVAERMPLPRALYEQGVRRYGFHGISYEYIMQALGADAPARVIIAHLGNGASIAAVLNGRPIDTTMGFTPAGGFMMGTRPGDLDPGVMLYLLRERGFDASSLDEMVNRQSGLRGVSGLSSEVKALLEARGSNADAALALEMFCYQIRKSIGAMAAALGGVDLLVFTGGIGEHAFQIRAGACAGLAHLGIELDADRNRADAATISRSGSRCEVRVIATDENLMVARHTMRAISA